MSHHRETNPNALALMSDEILQDEIDTFSHVCRHLGQFHVEHTDETDEILDRLVSLKSEQRRRANKR